MLARDLGDCRDNLRNSQSVFLIVSIKMGILEVFSVVPVFFALSKNKKIYDFETDFLHILFIINIISSIKRFQKMEKN